MTTTQHLAHAGQVFARVVQFALAAIAIVMLAGGFMAGVNILAFAVLAIFALALFALIGVVEMLLVRPLGRWSA